MKQLVNIKKVAIDTEHKVTVQVEFIAANREQQENVFRLIELQGDVVEVQFKPAQLSLSTGHGNEERETALV